MIWVQSMKIAVLADIHANLVGLETVAAHIDAWQPDGVIVNGDVVNRGPWPRQCLEFVLDKQKNDGWLLVRGNHEDYVILYSDPETACNGVQFEIYRMAYWTYQKLEKDVTALVAMPATQSITGPDGREVRATHASMGNNRSGIFPRTSDEELRQKISPPPAVFCTAHTHWPLVRWVDETLVVNVGSAGLPFDGDDRVAYAQLTWQHRCWRADIIRLSYDKAKNIQGFYDSGFMAESGVFAPLVMNELLTAQLRILGWMKNYEAQVLAGEISLEESVQAYMAELG